MKLLSIILILLLTLTLLAQNESFAKSKKELRKIYVDHQVSVYCDCKYNYKNKNNMIDRKSCGYTKKGKINQRARRIEWEHIIPVLFSFKNMDILNMLIFYTVS